MTAPLLAPGSMLGSRWIVGGLLGRTDTAEVYEAEATSERRFAALKLFDPALALEPAWNEHVALTRALSELPGDGLARAYDSGIDPSVRRPYVASERITFPTVARYVGERGSVPLRVLAPALTTLATALDVAHAAGIVHGGLKPQNVFVSFDNPHWARLTDFGVLRLRHAAGRGPATLLGWSAPEGTASPAADRFALALVCFFAATGTPWYSALRGPDDASSDLGRPRLASERARSQGAELDPLFDAWFKRALHAEPSARFGTASEMAKTFLDLFTSAPTAEMPARASLRPHSDVEAPRPFSSDGPRSVSSYPPGRTSTPPARPSPLPATALASSPPRSSSLPPARSASSPPGDAVRPAARFASSAPGSAASFPRSVEPRLSHAVAPRWFWLACAAMALLAVLAVWWLSRY